MMCFCSCCITLKRVHHGNACIHRQTVVVESLETFLLMYWRINFLSNSWIQRIKSKQLHLIYLNIWFHFVNHWMHVPFQICFMWLLASSGFRIKVTWRVSSVCVPINSRLVKVERLLFLVCILISQHLVLWSNSMYITYVSPSQSLM